MIIKPRFFALVTLFLIMIACGSEKKDETSSDTASTETATESKDDSLDNDQQSLLTEVRVKEVEGFTVSESQFLIPVNTVGNVRAIQKGKIIAQVSGIFQFPFIYEGQTFKKGERIGNIFDVEFDNRYKKGLSAFENRYITFMEGDVAEPYRNLKADELLKRINESNNASVIGRARQTGLYDELLNVEQLEEEKRLRTVHSPTNLAITTVHVDNEQNVSKGTALFDYVNDDDKVVEVSLFESESSYLKIGEKAQIKRHAIVSDDVFNGTVIGISRQISADRFRKVTIKIDEPQKLVDGEQVDVVLNIDSGRSGIQIPNKAIVYRDQRPVVFKVENDIAIWQYVDLGERFGDRVEITNGVDAGDKVITNGHFTLAHQANVNFKEVEPYQ